MLFISHRTADKKAALDLLERAKRRGYDERQLFLDSDPQSGIQPGDPWEQTLYSSLAKSRAMIVLCSSQWLTSHWCFVELGYAKAAAMAIFPLLIEDCDIGSSLNSRQAIDLAGVKTEAERDAAFDRLWRALSEKHLGPKDIPPWPPAGAKDDCPFPGLAAFDENFAPVYFGREPERDQIIHELDQMRGQGVPRMLMVTGGSGSGKSSLVRAGVWPWLSHSLEEHRWLPLPALRFNETSEQHSLLGRLAEELAARFPETSRPDWTKLRDEIASDDAQQAARAFSDQVRTLNMVCNRTERTIVLLVDQFEELLSSDARPSGQRFLRFLRELLSGSDRRLLVVGTMRSDYLDVYERHPLTLQSPYLRTYRLPPFPWERVTDVIVQPAARVGATFTNELLERLKRDAPTSDALPLLAFTLEKLFRQCSMDKQINVSEYEALGGMTGAIEQAVSRILPTDLPSESEQALRLSFVRHLVQVNEKDEFVRRAARWTNLPRAARPLLEQFIKERLLNTSGDGGETSVEVSHEALFRCWDNLKTWLHAELNNLRLRRKLESAAKEWTGSIAGSKSNGDEELFFTMGQLEAVDEWRQQVNLQDFEKQFLDASRHKRSSDLQREIKRLEQIADAERTKQESETRRATEAIIFSGRLRWAFAATAIIALVASVLFVVALDKRSEAITSAQSALQKARIAEANRVVAVLAASEELPQLRTLLAIESGKSTHHDDEGLLPISHQAVWDALTNIEGRPLSPRVDRIEIGPDSRWLVTTEARVTRIWELKAGQPPTGRQLADNRNTDIEYTWFSDDGRWLVTQPYESATVTTLLPDGRRMDETPPKKAATVWDLWSRSPETDAWSLKPGAIVQISSNSRWLAAVGADHFLDVYDLTSSTPAVKVQELKWGAQERFSSAEFSTDGRRFLIKCLDNGEGDRAVATIRLWDLQSQTSANVNVRGARDYCLSPDSRWLVVRKDDNTAHMWDLKSVDATENVRSLSYKDEPIVAFAISPDSLTVATVSEDQNIRLWSVDPSRQPSLLGRMPDKAVSKASFSHDGKWLIATGNCRSSQGGPNMYVTGCDCYLWSVAEGGFGMPFDGMDDMTVSPDGQWLVRSSGYNLDPKLYLYNLASAFARKSIDLLASELTPQGDGRLRNALFSSTSRRVVCTDQNDNAIIWLLSQRKMNSSQAAGRFLTISENNRWLITASEANEVSVWDLDASPDIIVPRTFKGHDGRIKSAQLSSDERWLVAASDSGSVRLWDFEVPNAGTSRRMYVVNNDEISSLAISADHHLLALGSAEVTEKKIKDISDQFYDRVSVELTRKFFVRLCDLQSPGMISTSRLLSGHQDWITSVAISADGRWVVSGSKDKTALAWYRQATGPSANPRVLAEHGAAVNSVAISGNGRWAITGGEDSKVCVWDLDTPESIVKARVLRGHTSPVTSVAISKDGRWIATGSRDTTAKVWDMHASEIVIDPYAVITHASEISTVAFKGDDQFVLTVSIDGDARLWDLKSTPANRKERILLEKRDGVDRVAMSDDGRWLVTHSGSVVRLWDVSSQNKKLSCEIELQKPVFPDPLAGTAYAFGFDYVGADSRPPASFAISSSADVIVTADATNKIWLWQCLWKDLVANAKNAVGRNLTEEEWDRYFPDQEYRKTFSELSDLVFKRDGG